MEVHVRGHGHEPVTLELSVELLLVLLLLPGLRGMPVPCNRAEPHEAEVKPPVELLGNLLGVPVALLALLVPKLPKPLLVLPGLHGAPVPGSGAELHEAEAMLPVELLGHLLGVPVALPALLVLGPLKLRLALLAPQLRLSLPAWRGEPVPGSYEELQEATAMPPEELLGDVLGVPVAPLALLMLEPIKLLPVPAPRLLRPAPRGVPVPGSRIELQEAEAVLPVEPLSHALGVLVALLAFLELEPTKLLPVPTLRML